MTGLSKGYERLEEAAPELLLIVHEMRNQLAVAVANVEAFSDGKLLPTHVRLCAVRDALGKIDALMNELRPIATRREPIMRAVDICALIVTETIAIEAYAQAAGIMLELDICTRKHSECSRFMCDGLQIGQVVTNVLLNAMKYTGRGGRVRCYGHREPGALILEISDSGVGVCVDEQQTIFNLGSRGSAAVAAAGSGFGLAIVSSILKAHGGTVTVANSPLGGALFVIRLPGQTDASDLCGSSSDSAVFSERVLQVA